MFQPVMLVFRGGSICAVRFAEVFGASLLCLFSELLEVELLWGESRRGDVFVVPGARVRPSTNHWVSYQPTIGYLTNQLLGILPTNLQHSFYQFSPPWQPMLLMIQVQVQHSIYQFFPPLGNPCLVLGFRF